MVEVLSTVPGDSNDRKRTMRLLEKILQKIALSGKNSMNRFVGKYLLERIRNYMQTKKPLSAVPRVKFFFHSY